MHETHHGHYSNTNNKHWNTAITTSYKTAAYTLWASSSDYERTSIYIMQGRLLVPSQYYQGNEFLQAAGPQWALHLGFCGGYG